MLTDTNRRLMTEAYEQWLRGERTGGKDEGAHEMGDRHLAMLRGLIEPAAFERWVNAPFLLLERAERTRKRFGHPTLAACVDLLMAIAADLLRGNPIRTYTLVRMRAFGPEDQRNVERPLLGEDRLGGRAVHAPENVKNGCKLEQRIRPTSCLLIRLFELLVPQGVPRGAVQDDRPMGDAEHW